MLGKLILSIAECKPSADGGLFIQGLFEAELWWVGEIGIRKIPLRLRSVG